MSRKERIGLEFESTVMRTKGMVITQPIKCRPGSNNIKRTNQIDCRFWKKLTIDWFVDNLGGDSLG